MTTRATITDADRAVVAAFLDIATAAKGERVVTSRQVAIASGVGTNTVGKILASMEAAPNGFRVSRQSYRESTRWMVKRG